MMRSRKRTTSELGGSMGDSSASLPEAVQDTGQIKASFKNGILKIVVPLQKAIKEKEKAIEIKVE